MLRFEFPRPRKMRPDAREALQSGWKEAAKLEEDAKRTVEKASKELELLFRELPGR
jgi:hypothetical protein